MFTLSKQMKHPIFSLSLKKNVYLTFSHPHFTDRKKND